LCHLASTRLTAYNYGSYGAPHPDVRSCRSDRMLVKHDETVRSWSRVGRARRRRKKLS